MTDNRRLGNKLRLMNQLVDLNSDDQVVLLTSLLKVLDDKSQNSVWCNLDARRMILAFLSIHHPYINTAADQEKWDYDQRKENSTRPQDTESKALEKGTQ